MLLLAIFTAFAAGCAAPSAGRSLHARLGGEPGVAAIVSDAIERTAADARTKRTFDGVKRAALKDLAITHAEFDPMVQNLRAALDARVGEREKNELLRLLAPMKRDVVQR